LIVWVSTFYALEKVDLALRSLIDPFGNEYALHFPGVFVLQGSANFRSVLKSISSAEYECVAKEKELLEYFVRSADNKYAYLPDGLESLVPGINNLKGASDKQHLLYEQLLYVLNTEAFLCTASKNRGDSRRTCYSKIPAPESYEQICHELAHDVRHCRDVNHLTNTYSMSCQPVNCLDCKILHGLWFIIYFYRPKKVKILEYPNPRAFNIAFPCKVLTSFNAIYHTWSLKRGKYHFDVLPARTNTCFVKWQIILPWMVLI
jgi:hypothetical protein